jgi:hypothetical protein
MPYPNSNSPLTIKLSQLFDNFPAPAMLAGDLRSGTPLADLAVTYNVISPTDLAAHAHIADWPADQQLSIRAELATLVDQGRQVTFNWELAAKTTCSVISFGPGHGAGITFRSPLVYPPYS